MPDEQKLSIRPEVPTKDIESTAAERFQNVTLRPVLKLQNTLLQAVFLHMMDKRKVPFLKQAPKAQAAQIDHSISKDKRLRFQLLGVVIGQFTTGEYATFLQFEQEAVRRIFTMMAQRLKDELIKTI
ncbi:MAG: hypothetical protein RIC19_22910 [Phaeodactylibacter sp.]|uniref:glyoxalase n=1 Tax=Phaeodactylibacter sp. TaxID=1940289 RepID=UPI0032EFE544